MAILSILAVENVEFGNQKLKFVIICVQDCRVSGVRNIDEEIVNQSKSFVFKNKIIKLHHNSIIMRNLLIAFF